MEQIGEGGMGVVYRARYVVNNREVAVKMLPADVTDKVVLARFERELEVLKSLKHQNIVRCFGGLCEDKGRFYAMELISGGTLESELQRRGRLPWELVVQYGLEMCEALECAHKKGVVHRDVKPSNFLITSEGQLKLSDFGLAMMSAARKITQAGKTAGTFLYMAPEQIRGHEVTPRTDLYALGCVFFELLTGKPPFFGETPAATLHMHLKEPATHVSTIALDCPSALDQIVFKLMQKDPAERYESAEEVAGELRRVNPTIVVRTPRRSIEIAAEKEAAQTRAMAPIIERREVPSGALPFWVTGALGTALAISLVGNLRSMSAGAAARNWEQAWISAAHNPEKVIRENAVHVLGQSKDIGAEGVSTLMSALDDEALGVRVAAATALGDSGVAAKPVLPRLIRMRKEVPDATVREALIDSVERITAAKGGGGVMGWLLSLCLIAGTGFGLYYWYRTASTRAPGPRPAGS
jgi:serine/threonine-protein kinase